MKLRAVTNPIDGEKSPAFDTAQALGEWLADGADIDFELTEPTFEELAAWMQTVCITWELRVSAF